MLRLVMRTYLHWCRPVSVHLSVLVVVTLELQLQIRPAGGDTTQTIRDRLGGVIKHSSFVFPHLVLFKITQEEVCCSEFTLKPHNMLQRKITTKDTFCWQFCWLNTRWCWKSSIFQGVYSNWSIFWTWRFKLSIFHSSKTLFCFCFFY